MILILYNIIHNSRTIKTQFYEFLVVLRYVPFNIYFHQSLLVLKIFIIKFPKYLLFLFLVLNAFFIPRCHVQAVQEVISAKTVSIRITMYEHAYLPMKAPKANTEVQRPETRPQVSMVSGKPYLKHNTEIILPNTE